MDDSKAKKMGGDGIHLRPCANSENPCHRAKCVCDENGDHHRPLDLISIHTPVCFSFVLSDTCGNVVDEIVQMCDPSKEHAGEQFLKFLLSNEPKWRQLASRDVGYKKRKGDDEKLARALRCSHCHKYFSEVERDKPPHIPLYAVDHDHYTGEPLLLFCSQKRYVFFHSKSINVILGVLLGKACFLCNLNVSCIFA